MDGEKFSFHLTSLSHQKHLTRQTWFTQLGPTMIPRIKRTLVSFSPCLIFALFRYLYLITNCNTTRQVLDKLSLYKYGLFAVACATVETKTSGYVRLRARVEIFVRSGPQPVYQDLSTRYDWPVEKAIVDLPSGFIKGNSKHTTFNPSGAQNPKPKDLKKLRGRCSCQRPRSDYVCDAG